LPEACWAGSSQDWRRAWRRQQQRAAGVEDRDAGCRLMIVETKRLRKGKIKISRIKHPIVVDLKVVDFFSLSDV
jgi:hypothetical protein